jgi:hypothetical protein
MNELQTVILGVALFCYMLYRQFTRQPVTRRDLLVPGLGALYLGTRYFGGAGVGMHDAIVVLTASLIGVGTGLLGGQMIRVWRDPESGVIYQAGGWRYAVVFLALLVLRVVMRIMTRQWDFGTSAAVLNDAFIGMMIGNYLGRAITVGARALALLDWQYDALPSTRRVRRTRRYS